MSQIEVGYRISYTPTFSKGQGRFAKDKGLLADVLLTLDEIARQAFDNPGEDDATHAERLDRVRPELFVALTRARDSVWLGYVLGYVQTSSALLNLPSA